MGINPAEPLVPYRPSNGSHWIVDRPIVKWEWKPVGSVNFNNTTTSRPTIGFSYKAPTVQGDHVAPKNYGRAIARLNSSAIEFQTDSHNVRGPTGAHSSGLSLYRNPWGCDYNNAVVSLPYGMDTLAIVNAKNDLNGRLANILEDFGQLQQSARQMGSILLDILNAFYMAYTYGLQALRWYLRRLGIRSKRNVHNLWLAFYYGIMPMVSTIEAIASSVQDQKKMYFKVTSTERYSGLDPVELFDNAVANRVMATGKVEASARCSLTVSINRQSNFSRMRQLGLSGSGGSASDLDGLITLWALTPWSFVIDWFIPVEGMLQSLYWDPQVEYTHGYVGRRIQADVKATAYNAFSGANDRGNLPSGRVKALLYRRSAYPHYPPPLTGLAVKRSLAPINLINASALLLQQMKA